MNARRQQSCASGKVSSCAPSETSGSRLLDGWRDGVDLRPLTAGFLKPPSFSRKALHLRNFSNPRRSCLLLNPCNTSPFVSRSYNAVSTKVEAGGAEGAESRFDRSQSQWAPKVQSLTDPM
jgi:hypothetical protein